MANQNRLGEMRELAETGASVATMEARLKLPIGLLNRWIEKGRSPKYKNTVYKRFFMEWRSWVSVSRGAAESQQLVKAPSQWLERSSSSRKLDDPADNLTLSAPTNVPTPNTLLQLGGQAAILAMNELLKAGISIDDSLRKGTITALPAPKDISSE